MAGKSRKIYCGTHHGDSEPGDSASQATFQVLLNSTVDQVTLRFVRNEKTARTKNRTKSI